MKNIVCKCGIRHAAPKAVYADGTVILVAGCCLR